MTNTPEFLIDGPADATVRVLLAHGAGAPMDSPFMTQMTALLVDRGLCVIRFEFPYMASRRRTGKKKPAPKAETLMPAYRDAVAALPPGGTIIIGGKSMGGRIASLVADELHAAGQTAGLVCIGYPFHPPGMPEKLRTAHLETLSTPALIIQGERDPFGTRLEIEAMKFPKSIEFTWIGDGDHDLGPRGGHGFTRKGNLSAAAGAIAAFARVCRGRVEEWRGDGIG
jgi:uncharacterized protein